MTRRPLRAAPAPVEVDTIRILAFGTAAWTIAFLALLAFREWLSDTGRTHWLGICAGGIGLGLLGIAFCRRRDGRLAAEGSDELKPANLSGENAE